MIGLIGVTSMSGPDLNVAVEASQIAIGMKNKIANRYHSYMPELIEKTKYFT